MEEILIEEKKYISTKRASKITGYAKDYVGQLCREGRVPARLVGRSWYVLESAIKDHRFGNEQSADEKKAPELGSAVLKKDEPNKAFPRYEPFSDEVLPSLNILKRESADLSAGQISETSSEEPEKLDDTKTYRSSKILNDSWSAWFQPADFNELELPVGEIESNRSHVSEEEVVKDAATGTQDNDGEVVVPIHMTTDDLMPHADLMPSKQPLGHRVELNRSPVAPRALQARRDEVLARGRYGSVTANVLLLIAVVVAVMITSVNLGYLDRYALSLSRVGFISGISIYNK